MRPMGFKATNQKDSNIMVELPIDDFKHILFMGKTGSGKTSGGINPVIDSRIANGYGMLVFDEKGKEHKTVKVFAHRYERLNDVLEFGKPHSFRINLLDGMSERQLERFLTQIIQGDSNWMIGAINMFMDIYHWLNSVKRLYAYAKDLFDYEDFAILVDKGYEEIDKKNVAVKHEVSKHPITLAEMATYFKDPVAFTMITQIPYKFTDKISAKIRAQLDRLNTYNDDIELKLGKLDELYHQTEEYGKKLKAYKIKVDNSEASGNNGVYFMLSSTLGRFANLDYINDPFGKNIVDLLENKHIVVINTESFSDAILSTILTKTLSALTLRAKKVNFNSISVIIDEANRVLTYDSDIHVDILRESKVEIVLAAQNHEQMIAKMGNTKWNSFAQNFNTRLTFEGPSQSHQGHHNAIDENQDIAVLAKAVYIQSQDLDNIELQYQANHGFYKNLQRNENEIAIYDHQLYENKKAVLMHDTLSGEIREATIETPVNTINSRFFRTYAKTAMEINDLKKYDNGKIAQIDTESSIFKKNGHKKAI